MRLSILALLIALAANGSDGFSTIHHSPPCAISSLLSGQSSLRLLAATTSESLNEETISSVELKSSPSSSSSILGGVPSFTNVQKEDITWDWKKLARDAFNQNGDTRPIILFDGVCNLCNGAVNFALDQDENAQFRFCSLQSKVGQSLLLHSGKDRYDTSSIVLVEHDATTFGSDAVLKIASKLDPVPLKVFGKVGHFAPAPVRDIVYKWVSENRHRFGEYDQCRLDFDGTLSSRFVEDPEEL